MPVIELIDAMRSGVIKSEFVIKGELGEEVRSHFHYWSINSQLVKIPYAWGFLAHFHPYEGCKAVAVAWKEFRLFQLLESFKRKMC